MNMFEPAVIWWLINIQLNPNLKYTDLSATRKGYTQLLVNTEMVTVLDSGTLSLTDKGDNIISELVFKLRELA